jgi:hypothetical protein
MKRAHFALVIVLVVASLGLGCGASLQAVYEGDVRFEHCMALDAEPGVKVIIRRACWVEWVAFYTYGQTRDRVAYAQLRAQQLSSVSEFVSPRPTGRGALSAPVPTKRER